MGECNRSYRVPRLGTLFGSQKALPGFISNQPSITTSRRIILIHSLDASSYASKLHDILHTVTVVCRPLLSALAVRASAPASLISATCSFSAGGMIIHAGGFIASTLSQPTVNASPAYSVSKIPYRITLRCGASI